MEVNENKQHSNSIITITSEKYECNCRHSGAILILEVSLQLRNHMTGKNMPKSQNCGRLWL